MGGTNTPFLEEKIPDNWYFMDTQTQKLWRAGSQENEGSERTRVFISEVWKLALEREGLPMMSESKRISKILNRQGWKRFAQTRVKAYGRAWMFVKD